MALPACPVGRGLPILGVTGLGMEDEQPPPSLGMTGLRGGAWRMPGLLNGPGDGPGGAIEPLDVGALPRGGSGVWTAKVKPLTGLGPVGVELLKQAEGRNIFAGDAESSQGQPDLERVCWAGLVTGADWPL